MNPMIASILGTLFHLKRRCPKCGREQVTPASKKKDAVACKFCGTPIPPKKMSGS